MLLTMENERVNPAQQVIRRFGGQSALASLLGKRQSTQNLELSAGFTYFF